MVSDRRNYKGLHIPQHILLSVVDICRSQLDLKSDVVGLFNSRFLLNADEQRALRGTKAAGNSIDHVS